MVQPYEWGMTSNEAVILGFKSPGSCRGFPPSRTVLNSVLEDVLPPSRFGEQTRLNAHEETVGILRKNIQTRICILTTRHRIDQQSTDSQYNSHGTSGGLGRHPHLQQAAPGKVAVVHRRRCHINGLAVELRLLHVHVAARARQRAGLEGSSALRSTRTLPQNKEHTWRLHCGLSLAKSRRPGQLSPRGTRGSPACTLSSPSEGTTPGLPTHTCTRTRVSRGRASHGPTDRQRDMKGRGGRERERQEAPPDIATWRGHDILTTSSACHTSPPQTHITCQQTRRTGRQSRRCLVHHRGPSCTTVS